MTTPGRMLVLSGPPCSGKSELARAVSERLGLCHLELDHIRVRLMPSDHGREARQIAYRAMALTAEHLSKVAATPLLDATYGPFEARRELVAVAAGLNAHLYVVQCEVTPDEAAARFLRRMATNPRHGATDLTEERVRRLAEEYPYVNVGLRLLTKSEIDELADCVVSYLMQGHPVNTRDWTSDPGGGPI